MTANIQKIVDNIINALKEPSSPETKSYVELQLALLSKAVKEQL